MFGRAGRPRSAGYAEAGDHLAALYSLVSTCEARHGDPVAYLKDVLTRVDSLFRHRRSQSDPKASSADQ
jgi:hypothetical protein